MLTVHDIIKISPDEIAALLDKWYKTDIYKVNVLAERFEKLEKYKKTDFKSVLIVSLFVDIVPFINCLYFLFINY